MMVILDANHAKNQDLLIAISKEIKIVRTNFASIVLKIMLKKKLNKYKKPVKK